jgi:hypothetical protein
VGKMAELLNVSTGNTCGKDIVLQPKYNSSSITIYKQSDGMKF